MLAAFLCSLSHQRRTLAKTWRRMHSFVSYIGCREVEAHILIGARTTWSEKFSGEAEFQHLGVSRDKTNIRASNAVCSEIQRLFHVPKQGGRQCASPKEKIRRLELVNRSVRMHFVGILGIAQGVRVELFTHVIGEGVPGCPRRVDKHLPKFENIRVETPNLYCCCCCTPYFEVQYYGKCLGWGRRCLDCRSTKKREEVRWNHLS